MSSLQKLFAPGLLLLIVLNACEKMPPSVAFASPTWKFVTVEFNIQGNPGDAAAPGILVVNSGNNGCARGSGNKKGCVSFKVDEVGSITFALLGQPVAKTCGSGVNRVITKIEITDTDKTPGAVPTDKGDFGTANYPLPVTVKTEAFPELNISNGVVYASADLQSGLNRVKITNKNSHAVASGFKDYWYKVTVSRCSDGKIWVADPRAENEGMN